MENDIIKDIFWQCHNVFWKKWRSVPLKRESPEWEEIVQEGRDIMKRFEFLPLAVHMIQDLLDELEVRAKAGETGRKAAKETGRERNR